MFDIYAAVTDRLASKHADSKPYCMLNQLLLDRPGEYITLCSTSACAKASSHS